MLQGDTQQAELFLKKAVQEAAQGFGADDPHVAAAENNLAELYRLLGEHNKAEALYLSVCKCQTKSLVSMTEQICVAHPPESASSKC